MNNKNKRFILFKTKLWSIPCPIFISGSSVAYIPSFNAFGFVMKSKGVLITDFISPVGIKVSSVGKYQLAFNVKIWSSIEGHGSTKPFKLTNI